MKRWEIAGESDNRTGMAHNWKIPKEHTHTHSPPGTHCSPLLIHTDLNFTSVWCYFFLSTLQGIKSHFSLIPLSQCTFECVCSRMRVCVCAPERTPVCVWECANACESVKSVYVYLSQNVYTCTQHTLATWFFWNKNLMHYKTIFQAKNVYKK